MARRGPEQPGTPGVVRIIGGTWRGRRLPVASSAGLRPTPDRVRETLFNWLRPHLPGARCLDLYAGTGALGFEAASQGAAQVVMVEHAEAVVWQLRESAHMLAEPGVEIVAGRAEDYLAGAPQPFDVVFVDPPYAQAIEPVLARLAAGWLRPASLIYVERGAPFAPPAGFETVKSGRAGQVHYLLLRPRGGAQ